MSSFLSLDSLRAAAQRSAWYDDNDEVPPNYNPFRKVRARHGDLERGDVRNLRRIQRRHSENSITPAIELSRRSEIIGHVSPKNANTRSSSPIAAAQNSPLVRETKIQWDQTERSQDLGAATSETAVGPELNNDERRRRNFRCLAKLPKKVEEIERPRRPSLLFKPDKSIFTVASQLKATLLCSWFLILLPAVPAGFAIKYANLDPITTFAVNFVAIMPLGTLLSVVTEELIIRRGGHEGTVVVISFG